MTKKTLTAEDIEKNRLKKNAALKKWRDEHKERVSAYMQQWRAEKLNEEKNILAEAKKIIASAK